MTQYVKLRQEFVAPAAFSIGVPPALLQAVIGVESNGVVGWMKGGVIMPMIRFEGHKFYKYVGKARQAKAQRMGLAHPKMGGVKNPRDQANRHKLFMAAYRFDRHAAIKSTSYGVGQVMGFNAEMLGFSNAFEFHNYIMKGGPEAQIDVMIRYIRKAGLIDELRRADFAGFARGYNGPAYKTYKYDTRMQQAYNRISKAPPLTFRNDPDSLRIGDRGIAVRAWQKNLTIVGFRVLVDGDFGTDTKEATAELQRRTGLRADGVVGKHTRRAMSNAIKGNIRFNPHTRTVPDPIPAAEPADNYWVQLAIAIWDFVLKLFTARR
jgi:hypothetical protein